jgi:NADPH-dependent glutamate synthase beta subunit-like oxidoreductase
VKIAVIGSGPAGLTAAQELAKLGYSVTIFEALPKPGGMLGWCIPAYRLPREAVDAEIKRTENLGVEFITGTEIGVDKSIEDLLSEGFEAVFIAVGAHKCRKLGIPGEDLKGVLDALDFLKEASLGKKKNLGDKVVVIGGGDVAMDAARIARIALHLGAKEVKIIYRRSRDEMPANPWEVKETEEEGIEIQFLVNPKRIIGENGKVKGLECVKMRLGKPDQSGRPRPMPVEGSEFTLEADTIIPAIGESPCLFPMPQSVRVSRRNTIVVDPFDLQTGMPQVFAGGDVVRGPSTVIEAIIDGKRATRSIHEYITSTKEKK